MPATAAPPPTSTPAPAAKASPATSSAPKMSSPPPPPASAPKESNDAFQESFLELEQMEAEPSKFSQSKNAKSQSKKAEPPKEEQAAPKEDGVEPDADAEDSQPQKSEVIKPEADPKNPKELRTAYEGLKKKIASEYEPKLKKLTELEAKVRELEVKTPELEKANAAKVEAIQKRNEELEKAIRFQDYKKSKEYQEVEAKYKDAWVNAERRLNGISITRVNSDGEEESRPLTPGDLSKYAGMEPSKMWAELRADIPDPAERSAVVSHVQSIRETYEAVTSAEKKAGEEAEQHAKIQQEQQQQLQTTRSKLWRENIQKLSEKYPQWFAKVEGDQEGNTIFERGEALADLAMNPSDLTPEKIEMLPKAFRETIEARKMFTENQVSQLRAIIRNKAANHDRMAHKVSTLTKRVAELEKSLKDYEQSGPDGVDAKTARGKTSELEDAAAELEAMERKFA